MAKAVTLKNNNNEEVYPVTDLSLVNGDIPTGRIADNAVTSDKIDWTTMMQSGEWILVDSASISSNTSGTTFLNVAVPTALQGADVEYQLTIGAEFLASSFPSYPFLNCRKSNGDWSYSD